MLKLNTLPGYFIAVFIASVLLLPTQAQESTVRDPVSLAQRLLGVEGGIAIPPITVPYEVGASEAFWVTKADAETPTQINAVLVAATRNIYVWVEEGLRYPPRTTQQMAAQLDVLLNTLRLRQIYGDETFIPGIGEITDFSNVLAVPDVDDDPHLYVLYAAGLSSDQSVYYNPNHSLPAQLVPGGYSNEHEMVIINTSAFPAEAPLTDQVYLGALIRAFYHMLADYNNPEQATWLKEALGSFILLQFQERQLSPEELGAFLDAPNTPLNQLPTTATAQSSVAAQQLFLGYTLQRFGQNVFLDMFLQPGQGMSVFDSILALHEITDVTTGAPITGDDLFADFVMANALNAAMGDGRYMHTNAQLERQQRATAGIIENDFNADLPTQTVNQFGTQYIWLVSSTPKTVGLFFNGQPTVARLPFPTNTNSNNQFYWSGRGLNQDTTLTRGFDLSNVSSATLTFDTWYLLAHGWNYAYVEVSADGGTTWDILRTEASSTTNPNGMAYGPGYTGISSPEPPQPFPFLGVVFGNDGMTITQLAQNGPLIETEVQVGDRIIGYDGEEWPDGVPNIIGYLTDFAPGDTVNLYIEREDERFDVPVVLGTRFIQPEPVWMTQEADLSDYAGQQILVRFEYVSLPSRENYGIAVDNIAIPEIAFLDDAESGVPGWTLNGWQQMDNRVPQQFLLQVAETPTQTSRGSVRRLIGPSDSATSGLWTFNLNPGSALIIAISGLNDNTDIPATFDLSLREASQAQPEATAAPGT